MKPICFTVAKIRVISLILFLSFWVLGYFGLFSPAVKGIYNENEPILLMLTLPVVLVIVVFVVYLLRSLYLFKLEISAEGITQTATFANWHVNWEEIESWEYSEDIDYGTEIVFYLNNSIVEKRIDPFFLTKKSTPVIISLINKSVGAARKR